MVFLGGNGGLVGWCKPESLHQACLESSGASRLHPAHPDDAGDPVDADDVGDPAHADDGDDPAHADDVGDPGDSGDLDQWLQYHKMEKSYNSINGAGMDYFVWI